MERENTIPPITGPFVVDRSEVINSVNSHVYFYHDPGVVVKQRKPFRDLHYPTLEDAVSDQQRLRDAREKFASLMPTETPEEVLPPVTEVVHDPPEVLSDDERISVSWISPLVENAKPLADLSLRQFMSLPPDNLNILHNIIKADLKLHESGIFMDIVGSSDEGTSLSKKMIRWGPAILWSKNIVISESGDPPYPVFIDREGREVADRLPIKKGITIKLYPLRLKLSGMLIKGLILAKGFKKTT